MDLSGWFGLVMSPICLIVLSMRGGGLHPGHRLLPGWRLWFLATLLTGSVNASEDHDLLQRFRQARAAEALQHSIQPELDNRWRDFSFLYGFQRPPIDQVHQAAIHRPESTTPHTPEVTGTIRFDMRLNRNLYGRTSPTNGQIFDERMELLRHGRRINSTMPFTPVLFSPMNSSTTS